MFKSKAQRRFLFAEHPQLAKRFAPPNPPAEEVDLPRHADSPNKDAEVASKNAARTGNKVVSEAVLGRRMRGL